MTLAAAYVLFMFMSAEPTPPEPPKPSRSGRLLDLVRRLIDYGRELAATLHDRIAEDPRFPERSFGICDLPSILLRIKRGLLRATALEARLVQSAARLDAERKPRSLPAQRQPRTARPAVARTEDPSAPFELPTEAEIAAWVRRRPIGAVVADICRDLGIVCSHPLWRELQRAIIGERGNCTKLVMEIIGRGAKIFAELLLPSPPPSAAPAGTGPPP